MKCLITSIFTFIFSFSVFADSRNLEWQKIELEEKIDFIYSKHLSKQFDNGDFIVKTRVQYNDPGMPKFEDLNIDPLKISDISFDESKGDYIAFSKVGLEVPLLGKYYQENQSKLKEIYRFNESYDLFKNIEGIIVSITLSNKLTDAQTTIAKNIAKSIDISYADIKPQVKFKTAEIEYIPEPKTLDESKKDEEKPAPVGMKEILEFIGKFGNALGMILMVVLAGLLANKLLNRFIDHQNALKQMSERHNLNEDVTKDEEAEGEDGALAEDEKSAEVYTVERFSKLIEHNIDQAVVLVKKWIKQNDSRFELALTALAQQLKTEELEKMFTSLNAQEREGWTQSIQEFLTFAELQMANKFITEEIVRELIGGSFIDDFDVVDMILQMDINAVKGFLRENQRFGAYLLNLLNSSMVSKVFKEISPEQVETYIAASLNVDPADILEHKAELKSALEVYTRRTKLTPFNFKIQKIVGEVTPDKEEVLYNFMSQQGNLELLVSTAKKNIPGKLIFEFSQDVIKALLQDYPMEKKVEFIAVLSEGERNKVMNCYPEGSNGREMLEMELETVEADELRVKRLRRQTDAVWKDFVQFAREVLNSSDEFSSQVEMVVQAWAENMIANAQITKTGLEAA